MKIVEIGKKSHKKIADSELKAFFRDFYGKGQGKIHSKIYSAKEKAFRFAAIEGGRPAGAISLSVFPGIAKIGAFAVAKTRRDFGIGGKLLKKCEQIARRYKCSKIWLFTFPDWPAFGFYKKHSYKKEALLRKHWGGKYDLVIMSKFLD